MSISNPVLPPLKPIPIKKRLSILHIEKGNLDVLDGAFVVVDKNGIRTRGEEPMLEDWRPACTVSARARG